MPIKPVKRPPPPPGLPAEAAKLWTSICNETAPGYFAGADLTLLGAFVLATSHKATCDALVTEQGLILEGRPHPAIKLSIQLAGTMAALAGKLRLCASSRTRPDAAGLKTALNRGPRPWETTPAIAEFFPN